MLKAIEFVKQGNGKVGKEIAKRSVNQNSFMNNVISLGRNQEFLDSLSEKCGELIMPVIEYSAVGGVYHQLKGFFGECMEDGIVGNELPQEKREKAPRAPRAPRTPAPASSAATIAMMARKVSRFAARAIVVAARAQEVRNGIAVPDTAILSLARNFRAAGKAALAEALENDYYADAAKAASAAKANRETELSTIMALLVEEYGADAVAAAAATA